jgi:hypothetical protein
MFRVNEFRTVFIGVRELGRKLAMCVKGIKVKRLSGQNIRDTMPFIILFLLCQLYHGTPIYHTRVSAERIVAV